MGSKQSKPAATDIKNDVAVSLEDKKEEKNLNQNKVNSNMPKDSIHMNLSSVSNGGEGGGCPMKKKDGGYLGGGWFGGKKNSADTSSDANINANADADTQAKSGCPVKHSNNSNSVEYNVYSQPIDPKNNMPSVANQLPSPLQNEKLPTERVQSTIPKGSTANGESKTWTYPSPQMFYNSLARKNKLGDTTEDEIESVVALHNNMNEKTWMKVIQWEKALIGDDEGGQSKLLKFLGRPSDLSPKARLKNLIFGYPLPFDRHDWTVVRNNGEEVRYVIDYYYDETRASETEESAMPALDDHDAVKSILVDVRPAADTPQAVFGRAVSMPMARHIHNSTKFEPLSILPTSDLKNQLSESQKVWANIQKNVEESRKRSNDTTSSTTEKSMVLKQEDLPEDQRDENQLPNIPDEEAKEIALSFASMIGQCRAAHKVVESCKDEADCAKASLALTMCLAKVVCPLQQSAVEEALNDENVDMNDEKAAAIYNATFDKALENMAICVNAKSEKAAIARQTHPHLFKDS